MRTALLAFAAAAALASPAAAHRVTRTYATPTAAIAKAVKVEAPATFVFLSGVLPAAEAMKGNTEAQATSVLDQIDAALKAQGMDLGDVVMMRAYLAADPATGKMDFAGWQSAYTKRFGTTAQPDRPSRSTVQVAALALPGALLEVEVEAARVTHDAKGH